MRVSKELLGTLNIEAAVTDVTTKPLDRTPLLIGDRSLAGGSTAISEVVEADYTRGVPVASETLTMPRQGFGPRPVNIIGTPGRVVYSALAERLRTKLPPETRGKEQWKAFSAVGLLNQPDTYVVEFDIASCYEYVDHSVLLDELTLQSADAEASEGIGQLLSDVFRVRRGLPQLVGASDLLSDAYLAGIERVLLRSGFDVYRYADDFKVATPDWGEANTIIEEAAGVARAYGLVLSTAKTTVRKVSTVVATRQRRLDFLNEYFDAARDDLTQVDLFLSNYGDVEEVETAPTDHEAYEAAFRRILTEWKDAQDPDEEQLPLHASHLPLALAFLRSAGSRVGDDVLVQIVFRKPINLQAVLQYVSARTQDGDRNWSTLRALVEMERQSAWAKLWVLRTVQQLPTGAGADFVEVQEWIRRQLHDRHETVRSEAAWCLGLMNRLSEEDVRRLAAASSSISRHAVAAVAALLPKKGKFTASLQQETPLTRQAYDWALEGHHQ